MLIFKNHNKEKENHKNSQEISSVYTERRKGWNETRTPEQEGKHF